MKRKSGSSESEATLLIWSERPEAVATQVSGLTSVAGYHLLPRDAQTIHDRYFDTPDRTLQAQKLAVRIREMDATLWITLKGPSRQIDWGGEKHLEIEAPWSLNALTRIVKELKDKGIELMQQHQSFEHTYALDVMSRIGLKVIQDREAYRRVRNIIPMGAASRRVLAELAIDSVTYHFSGQDVHLHELEIEEKAANMSTAIKTVIEGLLAIYGPVLRRWHHSKLATGKAIGELLMEGALEGLLDNNKNLMPAAYEKIDDYFKRLATEKDS